MGMFDYIIILVLLFGGAAGARNGFFKQSVVLLGTILCFILAWVLKNPIANFLSFTLPFWNFAGPLEGLTSLNIVLYQLISFVFLLMLFSTILAIVVGVIEAYVIVFVILFFLNQPVLDNELVNDSKLRPIILNSSPVLSNIVSDMNEAITDIYDVNKTYSKNKDKNQFNKEVVNILIENNVIDKDYVKKLEQKGKIKY